MTLTVERVRLAKRAAAYAIARAVERIDDLPPVGDPVYRWPTDLPLPRLVLFLDVPSDVRSARIGARGEGFTPEELLLQCACGAVGPVQRTRGPGRRADRGCTVC